MTNDIGHDDGAEFQGWMNELAAESGKARERLRVNAGPEGAWLRCQYPGCQRADEHDPRIHTEQPGPRHARGHD